MKEQKTWNDGLACQGSPIVARNVISKDWVKSGRYRQASIVWSSTDFSYGRVESFAIALKSVLHCRCRQWSQQSSWRSNHYANKGTEYQSLGPRRSWWGSHRCSFHRELSEAVSIVFRVETSTDEPDKIKKLASIWEFNDCAYSATFNCRRSGWNLRYSDWESEEGVDKSIALRSADKQQEFEGKCRYVTPPLAI